MTIAPDTTIGAVRLRVADIEGMHGFYEDAVGLRTLGRSDEVVALGADGGPRLVELEGRPDAPLRPHRSTGLFHFALLVPSRIELARALRRLAAARWPLSGASDHLVSEAIYLRDPEGNGIEIYRDRARDEWPSEQGMLRMDTLPLDIDGVMAEAPDDGGPNGEAPSGTTVGHVHLQVSDLAAAERFYGGALGFDVTVRGYPGALFLSAGGYHHHVGVNTWSTAGAPPPPPGARGLSRFEVVLPGLAELDREAERLEAAGIEIRRDDSGLQVTDPSGIPILLRTEAAG
jgi:catechol 2,3-dioxygenase